MRAKHRELWCRLMTALQRDGGQALTEYALVLAFLVIVAGAVAGATGIGTALVDKIGTEVGKVLP